MDSSHISRDNIFPVAQSDFIGSEFEAKRDWKKAEKRGVFLSDSEREVKNFKREVDMALSLE